MSNQKLEGQNTTNNVLTSKGTRVFKRRNKVKAAIIAAGLVAGTGTGIGVGYAIFHNNASLTLSYSSNEYSFELIGTSQKISAPKLTDNKGDNATATFSGSLPNWLQLNNETGEILVNPTNIGDYEITITANGTGEWSNLSTSENILIKIIDSLIPETKNLNVDLMYYYPEDVGGAVYYQYGSKEDINEDYTIYNGDNGLILEYDFEDTTHIQENFYWDTLEAAKSSYSDVLDFINQYGLEITLDQYDSLLHGVNITITSDTAAIHKMDINFYILNNHVDVHAQYDYLMNSLQPIPVDYLDIEPVIDVESGITIYLFKGIKSQYRCTSDDNNPLESYDTLIIPSYVNKIDNVLLSLNQETGKITVSTTFSSVDIILALEPVIETNYYIPPNITNIYILSNDLQEVGEYSFDNTPFIFHNAEEPRNIDAVIDYNNFFIFQDDFEITTNPFGDYVDAIHEYEKTYFEQNNVSLTYNITKHSANFTVDVAEKLFGVYTNINL